MLKIQQITHKKTWQHFLEKKYVGFTPFFQSWNWGDVQKKLGFQVTRLGIFDDTKLVGVAQVVMVFARRGNYFHLRHGPVLQEHKEKYYKKLLSYLKKLAEDNGISFIRISPLVETNEKIARITKSFGFRNAPIHNMDAEVCWVLDITQSEDTLLANMRKSHRYLIKKALHEEITIIATSHLTKEALSFLDIYTKLATSRHFVPHKGLMEEIEVLGKNNEALLLLAEYKNKIIGGAVIDFVGPMAIYHHGATDDAYRDVPISYLLQWKAIQEAKKRGKKMYNFWGIASNESKKHPWYGLTLFKMGFGGEKRVFLHAQDLPLTASYWKTYAIEMLTKIRKGY